MAQAPERLLFIRHGQTSTNTEGRVHVRGTLENLNEVGQRQAKRLIDVCKQNGVQFVYASPEKRALDTADIIAEGLGMPNPEILEDLRERNWGNWEGRPWNEIKQRLDIMTLEERYTFVPPGGES